MLGLGLPWLLWFSAGPTPALLQWLSSALGLVLALVWGQSLRAAGETEASEPLPWADTIAIAWLLAAGLSSAMALTQYFDVAGPLWPWVSPSHGEAFANLRQRNQFASLTLIGVAALLQLSQRAGPRGLAWTVPVLALLLAGDAASASRTGLVGLLLLCALGWLWRGARSNATRRLLWLAVPLYVLAAFALPRLAGLPHGWFAAFSRLAAGDQLCSSRLTLWSNVLTLIGQKPWTGWGWGELSYAHFITLYPGPRFCDILDNAHNLPLHLAVSLGLPAAVLLCLGALVWALRRRPWAEQDAGRQLAWSVLAVLLLHSLLEYPLWYGPFQAAALLCLLLLWRKHPFFRRNSAFGLMAIMFSAFIFVAGLFYVAWDYHRVSQIYLSAEQRAPAYRSDTLAKIQGSWLFRNQVLFAELGTSALTAANAEQQHDLALKMLHFSPEPMVVERVIESDTQLGRNDEALYYLQRFAAAFPKEHARWAAEQAKAPDTEQ